MEETKKSSGAKTGCIIAAVVIGALGLCCGGVFVGGSLWAANNPNVRRGFAIVGGAVQLAREGMSQPGAAEMRRAGCTQALVLTPDLMRRFIDVVAPDGGGQEAVPPYPMIFCIAARGRNPLTCEDAVRAYATANATPAPEIAVQASVQGESQPRCQGMYSPDGTYLREIDPSHNRTFGQMGTQGATGP